MNDLGEIDKHIGIDIEYSEDRGKMTLSQTKYRRVGGKRSYFEKALKKELFRMSVEKGAISNESWKRSYFEWASKKELSRKSFFFLKI